MTDSQNFEEMRKNWIDITSDPSKINLGSLVVEATQNSESDQGK